MAPCLTYVYTQILLLPLTRLWSSTCIRALEAPGLYYDACMTYFILELCCDIFPWVPDLDRTRLRVWLVYDWIGGVTSWYQSRLPVEIPLPHSLAEVESRLYKTFTNMAVRPVGPRRHWVVLGSFTPRSLLWDSELSCIRVKRFC